MNLRFTLTTSLRLVTYHDLDLPMTLLMEDRTMNKSSLRCPICQGLSQPIAKYLFKLDSALPHVLPSLSTVLRHVSRARQRFHFPTGAHLSVTLGTFIFSILRTWPIHPYLLCAILSLISGIQNLSLITHWPPHPDQSSRDILKEVSNLPLSPLDLFIYHFV